MRAITRSTPADEVDFNDLQRLWETPIDPGAIKQPTTPGQADAAVPAPTPPVDVDGHIHLSGPAGDIDLIGDHRVLRIEIRRAGNADGGADRMVDRFTDSSSPIWPLAQALSIAVDVAVDGSRVAFYDAASPDIDAPAPKPLHDARPGTDRRLDADEPYGDWTYVDPTQLPPEARGGQAPAR